MKKITCIVCPKGCEMTVNQQNGKIIVTGNSCKRGEKFAVDEMLHPTRTLQSTVKTIYKQMPRISVKTNNVIPKDKIFKVMNEIAKVNVKNKLKNGDVIIKDVLNLGVDVISTVDMNLYIN